MILSILKEMLYIIYAVVLYPVLSIQFAKLILTLSLFRNDTFNFERDAIYNYAVVLYPSFISLNLRKTKKASENVAVKAFRNNVFSGIDQQQI